MKRKIRGPNPSHESVQEAVKRWQRVAIGPLSGRPGRSRTALTKNVTAGESIRRRAGLDEGSVARRLLGDLAYRSARLREELAEAVVKLAAERTERRPATRQQVEVCFSAPKRAFGLGETLAKTLAKTIVGLVSRTAAKVAAHLRPGAAPSFSRPGASPGPRAFGS